MTKNESVSLCSVCKRLDFSCYAAIADKYGAHISSACASYHFPEHEHIEYCPNCGLSYEEVKRLRAEGNDGH